MKKRSIFILIIICFIIILFSAVKIEKSGSKKVLIIVTDKDFDDMQFAVAYARLKSAGFSIDVASPSGGTAIGLKSIEVYTDLKINNADEKKYVSLFITSGTNVSTLYNNISLEKLCKAFNKSGKILAAQEFSSVIFSKASLLKGKKASAWPTESKKLKEYGTIYNKAIVTKSSNIITGMGGTDENINNFTRNYIEMLCNSRALSDFVFSKQDKDIGLQFNSKDNGYWYVMTHNKKTRTGLIQVPSVYNDNKAYSLVFALHGMGQFGKDFLRMGFNKLAEDFDFIMVYPDGYNGDWDIIPGRDTSVDDLGYFRVLIKELKKKFNIDPERVYVTGHSLGGFMAYRLAYDLSDMITAAAPASGLVYLPHITTKPIKPVSILHLHSIDDWNVLFTGEKLYESPLSVMSGISFWKKRNMITDEGKMFYNRNEVKGTIWSNKENKVDVATLISPKGGHSWMPYATEQISEFFYNHPARKNSIKIDYKSLKTYNEIDKTITIDTIVQDNRGIKKVIFFKNGEAIGDDYNAPFSFSWNSKSIGLYRLTAIAELDTGELIHSTSNETIWITRKDLAYNKNAISSSIETEDMKAKNAFDGNIFTRWSSTWSDPQWIEVDLQKVRSISGVTLIWETAYANVYDIQVSVDHKNWKTIYSAVKDKEGTDFITFDSVNARYIRMFGKERATQWGYSIWDFMVHGE